ncbi:alpha/beta fold hydrolase [Acidisphaera sp. L21]|jgi:pimeloyl-ACP methyl ester carboxylesterase|uniref:alpha/beta fold hydrolase n=1 Tax=Acidisphaera sp. L21 TaxID=1641851 RepID=UPI00131DD3FE|nr:alpha/beta hydrolase [Acidisphaera sp. L21]
MIEDIVGRYMRVEIGGAQHRIYYEEAGQGIPLLCLHTAGSDTRQYRGLLMDAEITRHFRCISFDLPWHGKSSPPSGWWQTDYQLTTASYVAAIQAVSRELGLDRPAVLGCSIGGRIVLDLAARHAAEFRAVIGLQSSAHVSPYYDVSWTHRPDVHGGEVCAAIVSGLMAPQSPEDERWETLWHYMQGGPGIFRGDLHFYKAEGDLRGELYRIDTNQCRVWLLTGDYDYSCSPEATLETASAIQGASVAIMERLGHFPMSENYALFRTHLLPVLEQLRGEC